MSKAYSYRKIGVILLFVFIVGITQSCYHYRVLNTVNDPSTEYEHKVLWTYCWGLVNKPQNFTVTNCVDSSIDEVRISSNFGCTLLTTVTVGFLSPVKVEWKCHKPCQRVGKIQNR